MAVANGSSFACSCIYKLKQINATVHVPYLEVGTSCLQCQLGQEKGEEYKSLQENNFYQSGPSPTHSTRESDASALTPNICTKLAYVWGTLSFH